MQGGPRIFSQSSTASDLLDRRCSPVAYRTVTFCGRPFQNVRLRLQRRMARGHGLVRVRSPLLAESRLISFPPGTEMFQFPGFAPRGLCIQPRVVPSACAVKPGCPIRRSPDQSLFGGSPGLIAAFRVLHRLCTPRHPPYALSSLTTFMKRCGQHAPFSTKRERSPGRAAAYGDPRHRLVNPASIPRHPPMNLLETNPQVAGQRPSPDARWLETCRSLPTHWSRPGSNRQPPRCKRGALPTELRPRDSDQDTPSHIARGLSRRHRAPAAKPEKPV